MIPSISKLHMFLRTTIVASTQKAGDAEAKINGGFKDLSDLLMKAMAGVGIIFIVIGVISIATAVKSGEQNPEAITSAVKNIIIGVLLGSIGVIADFFLT